MKFEWEKLSDNGFSITWRAKVFGGWLVNNFTCIETKSDQTERMISQSMVFVPDPEHKWEIT
jgi:hypothetical protein